MESELSIGPFLNWFNPCCCDIWSRPAELNEEDGHLSRQGNGDQNEPKKSADERSLFAYGTKHYVYFGSIKRGAKSSKSSPRNKSCMRMVDLVKIFDHQRKVTTVAFQKDSLHPVMFIGSDFGDFVILDFSKEGNDRFLARVSFDELNFNDQITISTPKIVASGWIDQSTVIFALDRYVAIYRFEDDGDSKLIFCAPKSTNSTIVTLATAPFDNEIAVVGYDDGLICILRLADEGIAISDISDLVGHRDAICSLGFSTLATEDYPAGLVASSSRDGWVKVWDVTKGSCVAEVSPLRQDKRPAAKDTQKDWFTVGFIPEAPLQKNKINYFHLYMSTHTGEIRSFQVPKTSQNQKLRISKLETLAQSKPSGSAHTSVVFNMAIDNENGLAVSCSLDRTVCAWDVFRRQLIECVPTISNHVYHLAFHPIDPQLLAVAAGDGLRIFKLGEKEQLSIDNYDAGRAATMKKQLPPRIKITAVSWHPERENRLALGSDAGHVFVMNFQQKSTGVMTGIKYENMDKKRSMVYSVVWGPSPKAAPVQDQEAGSTHPWALYSIYKDGKLKVHIPSLKSVLDFDEHILRLPKSAGGDAKRPKRTEVSWRSDHSLMAIGNDDGLAEIFRWSESDLSFKPIAIINLDIRQPILGIRWHPNCQEDSNYGYLIALCSNQPNLHLVDLRSIIDKEHTSGEIARINSPNLVLTGHQQRINCVCWSPHEDTKLVTGSYDATAQVWDIRNPDEPMVANFRDHRARILSIEWSPTDPDLIFTGGDDNAFHAWRPSTLASSEPCLRPEISSPTPSLYLGADIEVEVIETPEVIVTNDVTKLLAQKDAEIRRLKKEVDTLRRRVQELSARSACTEILGESPAMNGAKNHVNGTDD